MRMGPFRLSMSVLIAVLVLLSPRGSLSAQWMATGSGPFRYDDSGNWEGGVINDQLASSPETEQTIHFTTDRTMPKGLLIRQPTSTDGRHYSVTFKARNAGDSAGEARKLALGGQVIVDFGNTNDVTAFFGDSIPVDFDFQGAVAAFEMPTGNSHAEIRGSLVNAKGLIKKGEGRLTLSGKEVGVSGEIEVEGGWLNLSGRATLLGVTKVGLRPTPPAKLSCLTFANEDRTVTDRMPDEAAITCDGASLIRLTGRGGESLGETLGRISINENCLELWASSADGGTADLTVSELVRRPGTILIVGYEKPEASSRVKTHQGQDSARFIDRRRGSARVPQTASIIPWVRGHGGGNLHSAAGFLTYSQEGGFRELDEISEYVQDLNASSKPVDNVRIANEGTPLSESKTINALYLDLPSGSGKASGLDLGGNTLTVTSGGISVASESQIGNGTLTTGGDRPLIISGPVYMNARLEGNGGLIYFGGRYPELRLGSNENALTGDYVVAYGAIRLGDSENIPDTVTVRLQKDTELVVDGAESLSGLAGTGRVRLGTRGRSVLVLGRSEGTANQLVVGQEGEIHPGDTSREDPATGDLLVWRRDDFEDNGSLEFEDGTLFIDLAEGNHDSLVFDSENKVANISGGTLSVNLLNDYKPKVGTKWDVIKGTAPATGQGFESIEDATGEGYEYSAAPVGNNWVLEVTATP